MFGVSFYPELISTGQVITELFERLSKILISRYGAKPTIKSMSSSCCHSQRDESGPVVVIKAFQIIDLGKVTNQVFSLSLFWKALLLPRGSRVNVLRILFSYLCC